MYKSLLIMFALLCLLPAWLSASIHPRQQIDFIYRGQLGLTDFSAMFSSDSDPSNPDNTLIIPLALQGQTLLLFNHFCAGLEAGILGQTDVQAYLLHLSTVLGWTDMLTVKAGLVLPLSTVYMYDSTKEMYTVKNSARSILYTLGLEAGILTLYYNYLMFNFYLEMSLLYDGLPTGLDQFSGAFTLGIRVGSKPKSRNLINLGWLGTGIHFF